MHQYGGLYADSDLLPNLPISKWNNVIGNLALRKTPFPASIHLPASITDQSSGFKEPSLLLGIEYCIDGRDQLSQWWLYGAQGHPLYYKIVMRIREIVIEECKPGQHQGDAVYRTGPRPFTDATWTWLKEAGYDLGGKCWIDPVYASKVWCSEGLAESGSVCLVGKSFMAGLSHFAGHQYHGSWKTESRYQDLENWVRDLHTRWIAGNIVL